MTVTCLYTDQGPFLDKTHDQVDDVAGQHSDSMSCLEVEKMEETKNFPCETWLVNYEWY